jgi:hypothetical protein
MSLVIRDPRFGIIDVIGGAIGGFITGGPLGGIRGALGGLTAGGPGTTETPDLIRPTYPGLPPGGIPGIGVSRGIQERREPRCGPGGFFIGGKCVYPGDVFPGGDPFITPGPGAVEPRARENAGAVNGGCPSGYHPNKTGYYTQRGYVPKGSRCVKNRRRNPANPRANDRAISRVKSAKRYAATLGRITIRDKCPKKCRH